jgi:hypothetical protein
VPGKTGAFMDGRRGCTVPWSFFDSMVLLPQPGRYLDKPVSSEGSS